MLRIIKHNILYNNNLIKQITIQLDYIGNKQFKDFQVHRLVALYFIPHPTNSEFVDHINHIITGNEIYNLRWVTQS